MVVLRNARFLDERARFALRYTCDDCGHFERRREACRHGWPTARHRRERDDVDGAGESAGEVWFCKEFEVA